MALSGLPGLFGPAIADSSVDWMDGTSQWAVGFVSDGPQSYCTIAWNSETGRQVEFRQSLKTATWRLSDSTWNFADNASAKIVLAGQRRMLAIDAVADGRTSLNVADRSSIVHAIIQNSIAGTVDLSIAVGDQGEEWEIPISRIFSMHAGVSKCFRRLAQQAAAQKQNSSEDTSTGF